MSDEALTLKKKKRKKMASDQFRLPNLLVLGVQKSGTTWLFRQLENHPEVFSPEKKELFFFNQKPEKVSENLEEYRSQFPLNPQKKIYAEASANYFWLRDSNSKLDDERSLLNQCWNTDEMVKQHVGDDVKFIIAIRHPIARAISVFYHNFRRGRVSNTDTILTAGRELGMLDMGCYKRSISRWLNTYPRDKFHFVSFEEIKLHPERVMSSVYDFLDVENIDLFPDKGTRNSGFKLMSYGGFIGVDVQSMEKANRAFLKQNEETVSINDFPKVFKDEVSVMTRWYKPHIKYLENTLGWDLAHWHSKDIEQIVKL